MFRCGSAADLLRARWFLRAHCLYSVSLRIYCGSAAGPLLLASPLFIVFRCGSAADLLRARQTSIADLLRSCKSILKIIINKLTRCGAYLRAKAALWLVESGLEIVASVFAVAVSQLDQYTQYTNRVMNVSVQPVQCCWSLKLVQLIHGLSLFGPDSV